MRKLFPSFYVRRDEAFFDRLWSTGRIAFDANMLLSFFRNSEEIRTGLYEFLSRPDVKPRLRLPYQAALEYHRNLHKVRYEPIDACEEAASELKRLWEKRKAADHRVRIDKLKGDVDKFAEEARAKFDSPTEAAWVDKVAGLFEGKVGPAWGEEELTRLFREGEKRYKQHIPPGFADASKPGDEKYGDLVVWKQLIELAGKEPNVPLVFVTEDEKEDWWLRKHGRTLQPHPQLLEEMAGAAPEVEFHIYSGEQFYELAAARGLVMKKVADEAAEAVRENRKAKGTAAAAQADAFARYIAKLSVLYSPEALSRIAELRVPDRQTLAVAERVARVLAHSSLPFRAPGYERVLTGKGASSPSDSADTTGAPSGSSAEADSPKLAAEGTTPENSHEPEDPQ